MKAFITGITGQDGSYLAELLLEKGYTVIGMHRRNAVNNFKNIAGIINNPNLILVSGDLTDYSSLLSLVSAYMPDEIYNLAAQSHVGVSFNEPLHTWDVTAKGCINLLEVIRYLYSETYKPRFYQAGSSEMFGSMYSLEYDVVQHFDYNEYHPNTLLKNLTNGKFAYQDEETPFKPQSPYAIAKVAAHQLVCLYRKAYGIHASNGILFNHESPRRGENFVTRKVTQYVSKLAVAKETSSFSSSYPKLHLGNLDAKRDWGYAKDYVKAIWMMLQKSVADDYVICTGKTNSVEHLCKYAFEFIGEDYKKYVVIDEKFKRPSEVPHLLGKCDKAERLLKWKPTVTFDELIELMIKADVNEVQQKK